MNVLKKLDKKMEIYRNKNYDIADIVISGTVGCCIGIVFCLIISI